MKLYGSDRTDMLTCAGGPQCCARHKNPNGAGKRANVKPLLRAGRKAARQLSKKLATQE